MRKWISAVLLLLLATAAVVVIRGYRQLVRVEFPETLIRIEDALASGKLLALVSADVGAAVRLESALLGSPPADGGGAEMMRCLSSAGLDPRRALRHVTGAVYLDKTGQIEGAVVLLGDFAPAAIDRLLAEGFEIREENGLRLVRWQNVETCEWSGLWALHVEEGRIVLASPSVLPAILGRLAELAPATVNLSEWRGFREGQLASLALFIPEETPDLGNPFLNGPAEAARSVLDDFRSLYLGAHLRTLPPGATLAAAFEANEASAVSATADRWTAAIESSRALWGEKMPTVARLHDALEIEADGRMLRASAAVDNDWWEDAQGIPGEVLGMFLGGLGQHSPQGIDPPAEQLAEDPVRFEAKIDASSLPAFEPEPRFVKRVDAVAGPVGLRLASVALGALDDPGLVLRIIGMHRDIPNLGKAAGRVRLFVTSVRSSEGEELLRNEICGPERNDLPADLAHESFSGSFEGEKAVRLVGEATHDQIAAIDGRVVVRVPSETEAIRLNNLAEAQTITRDGIRIELGRTDPSTLRYRVAGDDTMLLHVRGLNAAGKELQVAGSSSSGILFGDGSSVSRSFAGEVTGAELVIARTDIERSFPFRIATAAPSAEKDEHVTEPEKIETNTLVRLAEAFPAGTAPPPPEGAETVSRSGPFTLSLELRKFFALSGSFEVRAPVIPGLAGNLRGGELEIMAIDTDDGSVPLPDDTVPLDLRFQKRADGVISASGHLTLGDLEPTGVRALEGELRIRLPKALASVTFPLDRVGGVSSEGITATLAKAAGDGFEVRLGTEEPAVVGVIARNEAGEPLWVPFPRLTRSDEGWTLSFEVHGQAASVEIIRATEVDEGRFPFRLDLVG